MASQEKWCLIVNPTAGGGFGKTILPELEKQLSSRSLDAEIVLTEKHDHAIELSRQSLDKGCSQIISVVSLSRPISGPSFCRQLFTHPKSHSQ